MTTPTQGEHAQTEALRLADDLEASSLFPGNMRSCNNAAAAELRRLHAQVAALTAAPGVQAEPLYITHGPLMRHAAALLRSRKPVLPDHESVAAELELAADGHPTPSGEPSAEWLEVMRIALTPAQPAAPQGVAYAELPKITAEDRLFLHDNPNTDDIVKWVRDYARACIDAALASHRQAPAGACANCGDEKSQHNGVRCVNGKENSYFTPTAQAAPAGADVRRSDLVPGVMHCAKCKFQLNRVTLCVSDGNAYAGDNKTEPCPNGCGPLWPVTWEQEARNCWKTLEEMHERLQAAPAAGAVAGPDDLSETTTEDLMVIAVVGLNSARFRLGKGDCAGALEVVNKARDACIEAGKRASNAAVPTPAAQADSALEDAADPLQGAANWLAEAHGQFSPVVLSGCLMIGYNRAKRLHDAAIAARKQGGV